MKEEAEGEGEEDEREKMRSVCKQQIKLSADETPDLFFSQPRAMAVGQ